MCGHAALGWWQVCPCILLCLLMFPASGAAVLCAQDDFGTLFSEGHLPRQPGPGDFVQGAGATGACTVRGHGDIVGITQGRRDTWPPGPGRGALKALPWADVAQARPGVPAMPCWAHGPQLAGAQECWGGLAGPKGGPGSGWGLDTEGTEEQEEEEEGEGQGRKGWECPHSASVGHAQGQGQALRVLQEGLGERKGCRSWAVGELQGPQWCHRADRAMVTQARWTVSSGDWTQVWMLLLERLQGWNVGAPIVLSHSQECWGSPCAAPPTTALSALGGKRKGEPKSWNYRIS